MPTAFVVRERVPSFRFDFLSVNDVCLRGASGLNRVGERPAAEEGISEFGEFGVR